ncbi:hypothetical protein ACROYT_G013664 [Oculina patagonica]
MRQNLQREANDHTTITVIFYGLRTGCLVAAKALNDSVKNHVSCGTTVNGYVHWVVCMEHIKWYESYGEVFHFDSGSVRNVVTLLFSFYGVRDWFEIPDKGEDDAVDLFYEFGRINKFG